MTLYCIHKWSGEIQMMDDVSHRVCYRCRTMWVSAKTDKGLEFLNEPTVAIGMIE